MLKGKNAIVTGSTSGIGEAIATALAGQGCNVMLNGFGKQEDIDAIRKKLSAKGSKIEYSPADMTKPAEIAKLIADTEKAFGSVDILVNNAGIQFTAPLEDFPEDKWDAILATNLSAAFHTTKAALPGMQKRKYGRIINIASVHGLVASINKAAYVAAKHGIVGLTRVTAIENGEKGITCNAICPGWVHTPLVQKQIEDNAKKEGVSVKEASDKMLEKMATKEFVKPEQIGGLVVFLCGESATPMTGSAVTIDGGWTAE